MPGLYFLLATVALCYSGAAAAKNAPTLIQVYVGDVAILPCHIGADFPTVEWSKEGPDQIIAFLYRDGRETLDMKSQVFWYRTHLIMGDQTNGDFSLRISNVQLSDAGNYTCKMIQRPPVEVATVELAVGAVSEPRLTVVPALGGGLTLQCEARLWSPKPEIAFLTNQGAIDAEEPKFELDSRGFFSVTRRTTVMSATNRITCSVHQPSINQTRVTDIYIPDDCMKSCTKPIMAVVVTVLLLGLGLCLLHLLKKCDICVCRQKSPLSPQPLDQNTITELRSEIDELKLTLCDKNETICRLNEEVTNLRSEQSPGVSQNSQPTTGISPSSSSPDVSGPSNLPTHQIQHGNNPISAPSAQISHPPAKPLTQGGHHNHSSPALLDAASPGSSSDFSSENNHIFRSQSLSETRTRSNSVKTQRRNSTSGPFNNRFKILADLCEDSELLLSREQS